MNNMKRDGRGHEDSHQQHVEVERDAQETVLGVLFVSSLSRTY